MCCACAVHGKDFQVDLRVYGPPGAAAELCQNALHPGANYNTETQDLVGWECVLRARDD